MIPSRVKSQVSVRIVPDQNLDTIAENLCEFLKLEFSGLRSRNSIEVTSLDCVSFVGPTLIVTSKVKIDHQADWWLGRLDDEWFEFLEASVREEWGVTPLRIREGGVSVFFQVHQMDCLILRGSPSRRFRTSKKSSAVVPCISLLAKVL